MRFLILLLLPFACFGQIEGPTEVYTGDTKSYIGWGCNEWVVSNANAVTLTNSNNEEETIKFLHGGQVTISCVYGGTPDAPLYHNLTVDITPVAVVYFDYDAAGNRTRRYVIPVGSTSKSAIATEFYDTVANTLTEEAFAAESYTDVLHQMDITFYPNPTKGQVVISVTGPNEQVGEVSVISLGGKTVYATTLNNTYTNVDISAVPDGVYVLHVRLGDIEKKWKLVKQ